MNDICGLWDMVKSLIRPKYNEKYMHMVIRDKLKNTPLSNTTTNIVIPIYDIKKECKTILSTYKVSTLLCVL